MASGLLAYIFGIVISLVMVGHKMSERVGSSSEGESEREMGKGRTGINRERFIWMVVSEFVGKGQRGEGVVGY